MSLLADDSLPPAHGLEICTLITPSGSINIPINPYLDLILEEFEIDIPKHIPINGHTNIALFTVLIATDHLNGRIYRWASFYLFCWLLEQPDVTHEDRPSWYSALATKCLEAASHMKPCPMQDQNLHALGFFQFLAGLCEISGNERLADGSHTDILEDRSASEVPDESSATAPLDPSDYSDSVAATPSMSPATDAEAALSRSETSPRESENALSISSPIRDPSAAQSIPFVSPAASEGAATAQYHASRNALPPAPAVPAVRSTTTSSAVATTPPMSSSTTGTAPNASTGPVDVPILYTQNPMDDMLTGPERYIGKFDRKPSDSFICKWGKGCDTVLTPVPKHSVLKEHLAEVHQVSFAEGSKVTCRWNGCNKPNLRDIINHIERGGLKTSKTHLAYPVLQCLLCSEEGNEVKCWGTGEMKVHIHEVHNGSAHPRIK